MFNNVKPTNYSTNNPVIVDKAVVKTITGNNSSNSGITKNATEINSLLSDFGIDLDDELLEMQLSVERNSSQNMIDIPRIRLEHSPSGNHQFYLDKGENYLSENNVEPLKNNMITGIIFSYQYLRVLWDSNVEGIPVCSSIDNIPNTEEPIANSCLKCQNNQFKSDCKGKVRLYMLQFHNNKIIPTVFTISPTSIKPFNLHLMKLKNSKLPLIGVITQISVIDTKKNGFRWGTLNFSFADVVNKELLKQAIDFRHQLQESFHQIQLDKDYADPGDREPRNKTETTNNPVVNPVEPIVIKPNGASKPVFAANVVSNHTEFDDDKNFPFY